MNPADRLEKAFSAATSAPHGTAEERAAFIELKDAARHLLSHRQTPSDWVLVPRVLSVEAARYMATFDFDSVGYNELDAAEECWNELLKLASNPPPILKFSNPVFNNGRNLSVRRGEKWRGVEFAMIDLGGGEVSPLVRLSTTTYGFNELRDEMLADEHDPACRTVDGLFKVMCEVYPGFSRNEVVTLVRFNLPYSAPHPLPQPQAEPVPADVEALALRLESTETTDTDCLDAAAMLRRMAAPQPQASVGSDAGDLERAIAAARQATKHYFEPTTDVLRRAISSALALRDLLAALDAQAPQPQALCSNCAADGACMKRQALCAFTGKPTQSQASPQASAEDVGLISEVLIFTLNDGTWLRPKVREVESAWQRIRADHDRMGVRCGR
jgi:hypothetical protein